MIFFKPDLNLAFIYLLLDQENKDLFGGVLVLLTGDFRQILPVVPGGTKADEIAASIKSSFLWDHVQKLKLTKNMRVHLTGDEDAQEFAEILEDIGNGEFGRYTNGVVGFPPNVCVKDEKELIEATFPHLVENYRNPEWLSERAILAPKNVDVENLNKQLLENMPGAAKIYRSFNKVIIQADATKYPVEFLETLNPTGVPPHLLTLKEKCPVMLMRNLDPPRLCNGTRLQIMKLHDHVLEAIIISGDYKGEEVFIPRIPLCPTGYGFDFKRTQFPVRVSFAMTINKSQGQTLKNVGLFLETEPFSHGQFYVAVSRCGSEKNLKIFAPQNKTRNVVYREALKD